MKEIMIFQLNLKMESLFSISSRHKNIVLNNRLLMSPQVEKKSIESIDFKCFSAGKESYDHHDENSEDSNYFKFGNLRKLIKSDRYQKSKIKSPKQLRKSVAEIMIRKRIGCRRVTMANQDLNEIIDLKRQKTKRRKSPYKNGLNNVPHINIDAPKYAYENKDREDYTKSEMFLEMCKDKNLEFICSKNMICIK